MAREDKRLYHSIRRAVDKLADFHLQLLIEFFTHLEKSKILKTLRAGRKGPMKGSLKISEVYFFLNREKTQFL